MELRLNISTDNSAFDEEGWQSETARILRSAADKIEQYDATGFPLRDINGNTVGRLEIV